MHFGTKPYLTPVLQSVLPMGESWIRHWGWRGVQRTPVNHLRL